MNAEKKNDKNVNNRNVNNRNVNNSNNSNNSNNKNVNVNVNVNVVVVEIVMNPRGVAIHKDIHQVSADVVEDVVDVDVDVAVTIINRITMIMKKRKRKQQQHMIRKNPPSLRKITDLMKDTPDVAADLMKDTPDVAADVEEAMEDEVDVRVDTKIVRKELPEEAAVPIITPDTATDTETVNIINQRAADVPIRKELQQRRLRLLHTATRLILRLLLQQNLVTVDGRHLVLLLLLRLVLRLTQKRR